MKQIFLLKNLKMLSCAFCICLKWLTHLSVAVHCPKSCHSNDKEAVQHNVFSPFEKLHHLHLVQNLLSPALHCDVPEDK